MAADFTMKANDLLPSIQATLTSNGGPIDLSTATGVDFIMRLTNGTVPKVDAPAVIVGDPGWGVVRYDWTGTDTNAPGTYQGEWEITWGDGKKQTVPTLTYHTIDILADLDGA